MKKSPNLSVFIVLLQTLFEKYVIECECEIDGIDEIFMTVLVLRTEES
jgi:hypothetical protein